MHLNIRNGTSKFIIFRFSIIKKSERIYLDNPIKGLNIFTNLSLSLSLSLSLPPSLLSLPPSVPLSLSLFLSFYLSLSLFGLYALQI